MISAETQLTVLTGLVGVGVTVLLAGIPWAYMIHGRLTAIEAKIEGHGLLAEAVHELQTRVTVIEARQTHH